MSDYDDLEDAEMEDMTWEQMTEALELAQDFIGDLAKRETTRAYLVQDMIRSAREVFLEIERLVD